MKDIEVDFNWISSEPTYLIPTIEINKRLKCVSFLWLKWSLDFIKAEQ